MIGVSSFFNFQERCIEALLTNSKLLKKDGVILKSPTGSGKTLILLEYIERYLTERREDDTVFVWFTPGAGELEEQSQQEMDKRLKHREALLLSDILTNGFSAGDTVFINWEQVNKDSNAAMTDNERKSLYDAISSAKRQGLRFIIIVDEEHLYNTPKSKLIIQSFGADYIIRASATAKQNSRYEWFEIPEIDVINEGLITKALYINEDLQAGAIENEFKTLIDLADSKRKRIKQEYSKLGLTINPLILIQFPDKSTDLIKAVEDYLEELGYSYQREISKWLSDKKDKVNLDGITHNNGEQVFLLMKQAVATGWNCPRAKILVKLRERMSEDFKVQTIGRLRRMPQSKHYENELLDTCYLYTFDEEFKTHVKQDMSSAYEVKRIKLKDKCKTFTLKKENRDEDYSGINQKDAYNLIETYFIDTFKLQKPSLNKTIFAAHDYDMREEIVLDVIQDQITLTDKLNSELKTIKTTRPVNTHTDGLDLRQVTDMLKTIVGVNYTDMNIILRKLFLKSRNGGKLLSLSLTEYYAFIINNRDSLRRTLRDATVNVAIQPAMPLIPKVSTFEFPTEALLQYGEVNDVEELLSNAYHDYTTESFVARSKPERLFEYYCENNDAVEWVFKNGDTGHEYFSIVYLVMGKQRLFYPDYIVKLTNGSIWIIEAKGGEDESGHDRNIDKYAKFKFEYLSKYATTYNVNFGFVREKPVKDQFVLFLNNTEYSEDIDQHWKPLSEFF